MRVLILVDIQNDFMPGGALAVPDGDAVVAVANALRPRFELVVATQDWHPANHKSFAAQHPGAQPGEVVEVMGLSQILWPTHCVQESAGAAFVDALDTGGVRVFQKGTDPFYDSYSGFFDNGRKHATGLGEFLREAGVTQVFVCGVATDYCVKFTALDALSLGFETCVVTDACRGVNLRLGDVDAALAALKHAGARLVRSDDV